MSDTSRSGDVNYREVMASDAYKNLRSTFRNFAFPMTIAGLSSYSVFVILSIFAPAAMGSMAFGNLTWGMLLGLAQFAVVWAKQFAQSGEPDLLEASQRSLDFVLAHHRIRGGSPHTRGAVAGSAPVWGRYAPLSYPNWAAKFLVDALLLHR